MKVGSIDVIKQVTGGSIYSKMVQSIVSKHFDLEIINARYTRRLLFAHALYRVCKVKGEKDLWIRDFNATITMPYDKTTGKNIVIVHHTDTSGYPKHVQVVLTIVEKLFYQNLKRADMIVTPSKYWKNHFLERGYSNVHTIYNAFDVMQFNFSEEELSEFKKRFNLDKKPIIYIGNCQKAKGVVEVYKQLKDLDASIVTSGEEEVKIPAINLNLNYRDYLRLLKASSVVVTMSKFKEGWCRTAHEAMLCKTPVVGSGLGGMEELLEGGKQVICKDFSKLKGDVEYAMEHPENGENGYKFAKQFTIDRFEKKWVSLIQTIK